MTTQAVVQSGRFGAAAFSPDDIAGLYLWLDASDTATITATGGLVDQIDDKSGNARHLTGTGTSRPTSGSTTINGLNVLTFDGGDHLLDTFTTLAQPFTAFLVVRFSSVVDGDIPYLFDSYDTTSCSFYLRFSNWTMNAGGTPLTGPDAVASTSAITAAIWNGTNSKLWIDGGTGTTGSPGTASLTNGIRLAQNRSGSFQKFPGDFMELLLYDSALSTANVNSVGDYLADKWGLTWTTAT